MGAPWLGAGLSNVHEEASSTDPSERVRGTSARSHRRVPGGGLVEPTWRGQGEYYDGELLVRSDDPEDCTTGIRRYISWFDEPMRNRPRGLLENLRFLRAERYSSDGHRRGIWVIGARGSRRWVNPFWRRRQKNSPKRS